MYLRSNSDLTLPIYLPLHLGRIVPLLLCLDVVTYQTSAVCTLIPICLRFTSVDLSPLCLHPASAALRIIVLLIDMATLTKGIFCGIAHYLPSTSAAAVFIVHVILCYRLVFRHHC